MKITKLDNNHGDQLEAVYKEAGGSEDTLRNIWGADKLTKVKPKMVCNE